MPVQRVPLSGVGLSAGQYRRATGRLMRSVIALFFIVMGLSVGAVQVGYGAANEVSYRL